jgi:energy-coupling factor transporter ATP-binding protein EcfA2
MIRNIRVEGFKSIAELTLELGRVNCLIGANGVGKSNLLEAIGILGAAASGRVDDEAIVRRGVRAGLPRLYKTAFQDDRIPPHITLEATGEAGASFCVSLLNPLDEPEPAWSYKTEALFDGASWLVSRGVRGDKENLAATAGLAALKLVEMPADGAATRLVRTLQAYAIYCPNTPSLRGTVQDAQMRLPVGLSGGGLAEAFQYLRTTLGEERLDGVFDLIDWASDISATEAASSLLSSAALCLAPTSPKLLAVDNLDQALNPRLIARLTERLAGWLKATDPERQLLFTAHNPAVLDGLDLADDEVRLFAVERNSDGHTCLRRVTLSDDLLKLNKEYPLSRLWMMGHLGAVPNV